ncbi:DUF7322 domain-containing protein [Halomarina oriensis]|uniref:DUF7322 domain-containing protein n=1 Tax=Halomarina oriensis TaxID=671145 RepID=A0A6B0GP18_9EURY|nr:hypothetical protein [Halomarina oriensis]MWG36440.1 hypothetical protein [Halomarina oriensis]
MIDPFEEDRQDDPWPDEPEEFDPDSLAPSVDVPEAPGTPEFSESDVDDDLFRAFWGAVVMLNVALLGLSLGPMFLYFWGDLRLGGGTTLIGLVSAVFAYRFYAGYQRDRQD